MQTINALDRREIAMLGLAEGALAMEMPVVSPKFWRVAEELLGPVTATEVWIFDYWMDVLGSGNRRGEL